MRLHLVPVRGHDESLQSFRILCVAVVGVCECIVVSCSRFQETAHFANAIACCISLPSPA